MIIWRRYHTHPIGNVNDSIGADNTHTSARTRRKGNWSCSVDCTSSVGGQQADCSAGGGGGGGRTQAELLSASQTIGGMSVASVVCTYVYIQRSVGDIDYFTNPKQD